MRYRIFKLRPSERKVDSWGDSVPITFKLEKPDVLGMWFKDQHATFEEAEKELRSVSKDKLAYRDFIILPVYQFDYEGNET